MGGRCLTGDVDNMVRKAVQHGIYKVRAGQCRGQDVYDQRLILSKRCILALPWPCSTHASTDGQGAVCKDSDGDLRIVTQASRQNQDAEALTTTTRRARLNLQSTLNPPNFMSTTRMTAFAAGRSSLEQAWIRVLQPCPSSRACCFCLCPVLCIFCSLIIPCPQNFTMSVLFHHWCHR